LRVLVTGATGFIGAHITRSLLAAGHRVCALVRPAAPSPEGVESILGDVTVPESLPPAVADVGAVVHLAGVTQASRASLYHRVNTQGTLDLARAAAAAGVRRFVYASSLSAQGPSIPGRPHIQGGDEAPINDYGRSKLAAEQGLRGIPDLDAIVLRPSVVYGPGDRELLAWARLVRRRLVPSVGGLELSFLHVDDLTRLVVGLIDGVDVPFGPFFVSDGRPVRMATVLDLVERSVGTGATVRLPLPRLALRRLTPAVEQMAAVTGVGRLAARTMRELAAPAWACDPQRARETFGFEPRVRLEAGLASTFDWYREAGWR